MLPVLVSNLTERGNTMDHTTVNLASIFTFMLEQLTGNTGRIQVIDPQHVFDTKTCLKLHLYDADFKVTHSDKTVLYHYDLPDDVKRIVGQIRDVITTPEYRTQREELYPQEQQARINRFKELAVVPTKELTGKVVDEGTVVYTG